MDKISSSFKTMILLGGFFGTWLTGCASENATETADGSEEGVKIYWNSVGADGAVVLNEETISQAQAEALLHARANNATQSALNVVENSAETVGSASWSDCQYYNWTLFTSQPNGGGSIYCATIVGDYYTNNRVVTLPFTPYWVDAGMYETLLCNEGGNACAIGDHGYLFSGVRMIIGPYSGSQNIDDPAGYWYSSVTAGNRMPI